MNNCSDETHLALTAGAGATCPACYLAWTTTEAEAAGKRALAALVDTVPHYDDEGRPALAMMLGEIVDRELG